MIFHQTFEEDTAVVPVLPFVIAFADILVREALIDSTEPVIIRRIKKTKGSFRVTVCRIDGTRVVEGRRETTAVPGFLGTGEIKIVSISVRQERHVTHPAGIELPVLHGECHHHFGTGSVGNMIDISVVVSEAVSTVCTVQQFLRQGSALVKTRSTGKDFAVEQQTHADDSVHCLIHPVTRTVIAFLYHQQRIAFVQLLGDKVKHFLTTGLKIIIRGTGNNTVVGSVQGDGTSPYLKTVVIRPCAESSHLGDVSIYLVLRHIDIGGIDLLQIGDERIAQTYRGPCRFP